MTARELVNVAEAFGVSLIGRKVHTEAIGEYPGGIATVIQILPDPACPDIVFQVEHPTYGEMGVFEYEDSSLADLTPTSGSD